MGAVGVTLKDRVITPLLIDLGHGERSALEAPAPAPLDVGGGRPGRPLGDQHQHCGGGGALYLHSFHY